LLGNGDKGIEIVYGEKKNVEQQRQDKIACNSMTSPMNQLKKEPLSFVFFESLIYLSFNSSQGGGAALPSLSGKNLITIWFCVCIR
jgi:hypothetical protein